MHLSSESRSTPAAARALNIDPKRLCAWQKVAQQTLPVDPAEAADVRALRQANKRLTRELGILEEAIASKRFKRVISKSPMREPVAVY